ncbi:MAG: PilZ domain-containing protein [Deltaproteobacteria bacterium]|nr:PilZ domain-containing protein [Deltaproteobacteria bacterium]
MTKKKSAEQRKHNRIRVKSHAFVGVGPHFNQVGPLTDISKGGLAFCYTARKKQPNGLSLDIFLTDGDFCLSYVPFKEVSDSEVPNNTAGYAPIRRCRVQFGDLTENQLSRLEHIIQKHNINEL